MTALEEEIGDIIDAHENDWLTGRLVDLLANYVREAVAAERAACADVATMLAALDATEVERGSLGYEIATAIRARP